ncbi:hypothetical protein NITHO_460019 [Nitrolancea hollandica Lb]|uniref:Uncharacterized protein n=1 Tax=Nitrolancea hollandica Lb TaxID=1129897 RepID=I4EKH1_9BACT|nr:hypothetical protein NITHO_460019 [Nitrolancea hollandica Lb]
MAKEVGLKPGSISLGSVTSATRSVMESPFNQRVGVGLANSRHRDVMLPLGAVTRGPGYLPFAVWLRLLATLGVTALAVVIHDQRCD